MGLGGTGLMKIDARGESSGYEIIRDLTFTMVFVVQALSFYTGLFVLTADFLGGYARAAWKRCRRGDPEEMMTYRGSDIMEPMRMSDPKLGEGGAEGSPPGQAPDRDNGIPEERGALDVSQQVPTTPTT